MLFRRSSAALESSGIPAVPNNLRSQTPDRLSSCSDNRRVRVSERHTTDLDAQAQTHPSASSLRAPGRFTSSDLVSFVWVWQPDGAESVASAQSSDGASEKRAAGLQTPSSGTPIISVSRASVSSGVCFRFHLQSSDI